MDEDDTHEIIRFDGTTAILRTGLDMAMMRARGAYLQGRISVEQFEDEVDRLLHKRAALTPYA